MLIFHNSYVSLLEGIYYIICVSISIADESDDDHRFFVNPMVRPHVCSTYVGKRI